MSSRLEISSWIPGYAWWFMLIAVIAAGLIGSWAIAAGVLLLFLVHTARPFDFLAAFLVTMAGAAFVYYEGGRLTFEFSLLTGAILLMLSCYVLSNRGRLLGLCQTRLTAPLLVFVALSLANYLRGLLAGHPPKFATIEILGVLALGSTVLVANGFDSKRDLRLAFAALVATAFGSAASGFYIYSVIHTRTSGVYFTAFPGIVAILLINMALRSSRVVGAFGWVALSLPLFLHQYLSYRRGLWIGCLAAMGATIPMFAGFGRGSERRWRRAILVLGMLLGLGFLGTVVTAHIYGQAGILEYAGERLASIGGTEIKNENYSNLVRLAEYAVVIGHILQSPIVGHGIGFTFNMTEPFTRATHAQWWVHQNYLFISVKQGIIGLAVFLWLIASAFLLGLRGARRCHDPWESAWFATTAGATVFLAVFSLSDIPFMLVNQGFLMALLWGGAMAMARDHVVWIKWAAPSREGTA